MQCSPTWVEDYFYVADTYEHLIEPFEPLRCIRLDPREVRRSSERVAVHDLPDRSVLVSVSPATNTPSGYVVPWEIRVGSETCASLHPPPWLTFATSQWFTFVDRALQAAAPAGLAEQREHRLRQVELAMRSAPLLDHVRTLTGRRMVVQWFDGDEVWSESTFVAGRELLDALIDPGTRNRPHLIQFPDGWIVDGRDWVM